MIIRSRHHPVIDPFFRRYCRRKTVRNFDQIVIDNKVEDNGLPILLIANHMSWWDGIWLNYLNARLFERKFNFMMLEEQLRKHWYFQYIGGFSVNKGSRSVVETIKHAAELLTDNDNLVLMFPQGEIHSLYNDNFIFETGIEHILSRMHNPLHIVFVANMVDYLSQPKPGLYVYMEEYKGVPQTTAALQEAYNLFYSGCLDKQKKLKE
jgi:1-acyl-sn-glycerol-3-phosphate acyltransferase